MVPKADLMKTGLKSLNTTRHMTWNMSYLSNFKEFDRGYVTCGGGANGGKITGKGTFKSGKLDFEDVYFVKELQFNLFSVSQMCDKKNSVLFTNTGCFVMSPDFKLKLVNTALCNVQNKGKLDGKSDEGFFIGYSMNSDGPKWLFDIDVLTKSMNYVTVVVGTNSNDHVDGSLFDSSSMNASNDEPQPFSDAGNKDDEVTTAPFEATHADFFGDDTKINMNNITTTYLVPSIPNTRIHKDHSLDHVIGDVQSGV
ncbi:hypothetical protein Tco_0235959 [Tanacetum coccineum]